MDLELAAEIASRISTLLFIALAFAAFRVQRRHRDAASKWLVLAFGTLAAALAASQSGLTEAVPAVRAVVLLGVLAFPVLLLQFTTAIVPLPRLARLAPVAVLGVVAAWTPWVVPLPDDGRSAIQTAFVTTFLLLFAGTSLGVAVRMWRAGRGQPTIARRRTRTLSLATVLLSVALLVTGTTGDDPAVALLVQVLAIASTAMFAVAFLPPAILRASWRAREEDELYRAALRLLAATSPDDVAAVLLPHVTRVVGGSDAVLETTSGEVLARYGDPQPERDRDALEVTLSRIRLRVGVSPYTPFFGEDEGRLLLRLGLLADLALDRADLLAREQAARTETETVNAELEAFVYSASHDLKTPLITILGFLEVLGDDPAALPPDDRSLYLGRIRANARYMQELIGDLLELSRIGRVETAAEPVDLDEVLDEVADGVTAAHPDVTITSDRALPTLVVNRTRLRQLIGNLVENAARYGGRPDVEVTVTAEVRDDVCELRVADDGVGVPPEHRERVFGVFERLSTAEDGTGIGLAICRKIVAELRGEIGFADRDRGADVRIRLPRELVVDPSSPPTPTGAGGVARPARD